MHDYVPVSKQPSDKVCSVSFIHVPPKGFIFFFKWHYARLARIN